MTASPQPIPRCEICDWPLADSQEKGCIPGDCSYRPDDPAEQQRIRRRREALSTSPSQPTTSEALAQNLEGYARDCIHIGSVESVNDLINAAAIIRDAIAAPPTSPSVDAETKLVYIKRWRTIVRLPAAYADEIREALSAPRAPNTSPSVEAAK